MAVGVHLLRKEIVQLFFHLVLPFIGGNHKTVRRIDVFHVAENMDKVERDHRSFR